MKKTYAVYVEWYSTEEHFDPASPAPCSFAEMFFGARSGPCEGIGEIVNDYMEDACVKVTGYKDACTLRDVLNTTGWWGDISRPKYSVMDYDAYTADLVPPGYYDGLQRYH